MLAAAQEGSEAAFSRLFRDANPALLRYLRVIAPQAAEDVAAETWLRVVRALMGFRGDERGWRAWLFTMARRCAIDEARRRSRRPERVLEETLPGRLPIAPDTADLALEHIDTRSALALVAQLPPHQAEVIQLRVVAALLQQMDLGMRHRAGECLGVRDGGEAVLASADPPLRSARGGRVHRGGRRRGRRSEGDVRLERVA